MWNLHSSSWQLCTVESMVGTGICQVQTNLFCFSIFRAGQRSLGPRVELSERPCSSLILQKKAQSGSSAAAADGQVDLGIFERVLVSTCSVDLLLHKLNVLMLIKCYCLEPSTYSILNKCCFHPLFLLPSICLFDFIVYTLPHWLASNITLYSHSWVWALMSQESSF